MYNPTIQENVAPAEYWRERDNEFRYQFYLRNSKLLPFLNNEITHDQMDRYKERFMGMNRVMLVMDELDETLVPRETSFFQEFDFNGNVTAYKETDLYKMDAIGLKTMQENGQIERYLIKGGGHIANSKTCQQLYQIPFLYGDLEHQDEQVLVDCL